MATRSFEKYDVEHYIEPVEIVALAVFETIWTEVMQTTLSSEQPLNKIKDLGTVPARSHLPFVKTRNYKQPARNLKLSQIKIWV